MINLIRRKLFKNENPCYQIQLSIISTVLATFNEIFIEPLTYLVSIEIVLTIQNCMDFNVKYFSDDASTSLLWKISTSHDGFIQRNHKYISWMILAEVIQSDFILLSASTWVYERHCWERVLKKLFPVWSRLERII